MSKRLKKGDEVFIIAGNDKGKRGKIQAKLGERVVVEGINLCKKAVKKSEQHPNGGFVTIERPLNISNVRLLGAGERGVRLRARIDAKKKTKELYYVGADKKAVVHRGAKEGKKG